MVLATTCTGKVEGFYWKYIYISINIYKYILLVNRLHFIRFCGILWWMRMFMRMEARGGMEDNLLTSDHPYYDCLSQRTITFGYDASLSWCSDKEKYERNYKIRIGCSFSTSWKTLASEGILLWEGGKRGILEEVEYMRKRTIPGIERCKRHRQKWTLREQY